MNRFAVSSLALACALSVAGCAASNATAAAPQAAAPAPAQATTPAAADAFVKSAEDRLYAHNLTASRVDWVNATYITTDTDALSAEYAERGTKLRVELALEAAKYAEVPGLSADTARKLDIMRQGITLPAPTREGAAGELAQLSTSMASAYGRGRGTLNGKPISGSDIEAAMGTNRNPKELLEMWTSWHDNVGAPMRDDYAKAVIIANEGSKELGFTDVGAMWRSGYDMPADDFAAETDKLWKEVEPLYIALHTYMRTKLNEEYGTAVQPATGPINSHLLGNMWAQGWSGIYDIAAPAGVGDVGYDVGDLLKAQNYDANRMTKSGEQFFSSLGFAPLPQTFWERSLFTKPADREVQCHASAWNLDDKDDLRIKMCIQVNADDFITIHHELGHNYYQRAYKAQPLLYRDGANDGFHEAIGDMVALAITPDYLVQTGLLPKNRVPSADKDIGLLLRQAMDKVAFLPFGLMVDRWRWGVYSGEIAPGAYQKGWDDLRLRYQGVKPPVARDESKFDPGAKYHIPGNVPYTRYFLAHILQFQFYEAACKQAGWTGPLHRCSFAGNEEVGTRFNAMLEMGRSKPWPDALEAFTGTREMSGRALVEYFAPLKAWLDEQNRGKPTGW